MRKHADGVTVGALSHTQAILHVLGGGDPRVAYNSLKHVLLRLGDSLAVTAASYSLGYASNGSTHLDRISDFGRDYGYDQRQGRRYSDRGIAEISRRVASEWTVEASPTLEVTVKQLDRNVIALDTCFEHFYFIDMQQPKIELQLDGVRLEARCDWNLVSEYPLVSARSSRLKVDIANQPELSGVSFLWRGEAWPQFQTHFSNSLQGVRAWSVTSLAARMLLSCRVPGGPPDPDGCPPAQAD